MTTHFQDKLNQKQRNGSYFFDNSMIKTQITFKFTTLKKKTDSSSS